MRFANRRRLERLFDGRATLEEELALERDAAHDGELAAGLAGVRALLSACEALPQPAYERFDVEALVADVRGALERGRPEATVALEGSGALAGLAPSARPRRRQVWLSVAAGLLCLGGLAPFVVDRASTDHTPAVPGERRTEQVVAAPDGALLEAPAHQPESDRTAHAEPRETDVEANASARALPSAALPSAPVDGAQRDAAMAALADVFTRAEVLGDLELTAPGGAAAFAARADAAFGAEVTGLWPLASLAGALLEHADPAVAATAARYVAARPDALTAGRLARALEREFANALERDFASAPDTRGSVRLAAASALAELGAFDALARRFDDLCAAGAAGEQRDLEVLLAAWRAAGREELGPELARALPRGWRPGSEAALAHLGALGRPGADALARLALEGAPRAAADRGADALALLASSPFGASAVEDLVRTERSPSGGRLERACALVEGTGALGALDWLAALARRGEARALVALARLPGAEPVATLVELDAEGFVRDDRVWAELVSIDASRVAAYVTRVAGFSVDDAERVVACMIASGADAAALALASAAGEPRISARARERAALALAELDPSQVGVNEARALGLALEAALTGSWRANDDGLVAALVVAGATWLGAEPLTRALERVGALGVERVVRAAATGRSADSALARQERVERTLATARVVARETGRGNRGT